MVSITAINTGTGKTKWKRKVVFPSLGSPLVTSGLVFSGYIPFAEKPCIKYTLYKFYNGLKHLLTLILADEQLFNS